MLHRNFRIEYRIQVSIYFLLLTLLWAGEAISKDLRKVDPGIYGEVKTGFAYKDNVFRRDSSKESDYLFIAQPSLLWKAGFGKHFLVTRYTGEYAKYFSLDEQDYNDHAGSLDLGFNFTEKFYANFGGEFVRSHYRPQAPGVTIDDFRSVTRWSERRVHGTFVYGRRNLGAAEIALSVYGTQRRHHNNSQDVRDRDGVGVKLGYDQPLTQKTRLLSVFKYNRYNFTKSNLAIDQDNQGYSFWAGISWDHTAKTTSRVLVGFIRQISDSSSFKDFSGVGVEADVFWEPQEDDLITFSAYRIPKQSSARGSGFFISNRVGVNWRHNYEDYIHINSGVRFRYDDYSAQQRTEKYAFANVGISYSLTTLVEVGCEYNFTFRDSSLRDRDYRANTVNLFVRLTPTF
ncbi:MAG TPA: hypothetical protein ENJ32_06370 [Crenotrichaceae bacterium]|nr:hypothetical protein [Crenotrichaceae bacterium]